MYAHCVYCRSHLGGNEVIAVFPVGRRLAFDEARGRLWVVCARCTRWNLSPLEERWEAIDACEHAFRAAARQVGTENIGFAVLPAGLELVRVGRAGRPELAAWRYGRQLLRRRRLRRVAQTVNAVGIMTVGAPVTWPLEWYRDRRIAVHVRDEHGSRIAIRGGAARDVRLRPSDDAHGWLLAVPHEKRLVELHGAEAVRVAGVLLARLNINGAAQAQVETAVQEIERAGGCDDFFRVAAQRIAKHEAWALWRPYDHRLRKSPMELRLAIEMAAHEEAERRALEGELALLEDAWREAEEIAAIADDLLVPAGVRAALGRMRNVARTTTAG
jgi:hypothetical protein